MVKSLVDILAEIDERQPVRRFQAGGMGGPDEEQGSMAGDMTPSDPGQDDTLGEEDEGPGPDITQEQSEPSEELREAINDLYAQEDLREYLKKDILDIYKKSPLPLRHQGKIVDKETQKANARLGKLEAEKEKDDGIYWVASFLESLGFILS